jgi:hypothetical protein
LELVFVFFVAGQHNSNRIKDDGFCCFGQYTVGARDASASLDQTVKLWDTRPLTVELRIEQQAVNMLNMWFAKPLSKAEILERIRSDQTIKDRTVNGTSATWLWRQIGF